MVAIIAIHFEEIHLLGGNAFGGAECVSLFNRLLMLMGGLFPDQFCVVFCCVCVAFVPLNGFVLAFFYVSVCMIDIIVNIYI